MFFQNTGWQIWSIHMNIWSLTWNRNLTTRKLKTVIKANYCNYHFLTYPTRCSQKNQTMRKKIFSRNIQTDFTQNQQKLCCNFETVIIAQYFNISRLSSVSYNIVKSCAKMYSTTVFSSLPRTIDHREGRTGNIIIFNKTSSSIYRKGKKIRWLKLTIDLDISYIKTIVLRTLPEGFSKSLEFGPNPCWC